MSFSAGIVGRGPHCILPMNPRIELKIPEHRAAAFSLVDVETLLQFERAPETVGEYERARIEEHYRVLKEVLDEIRA